MINLDTAARYITFFIPHVLSKSGTYITHNAIYPQSHIAVGNLSDYMQLLLEPQIA